MYKIRIKNSPSNKQTGDQEQYGLVRNLSTLQTSPDQVTVNSKMGAIPREKANIEVEGGESVVGDVNRDGIMELMHFVGKRHHEGGVPVNIPEGSFIFSDTKKLTIKDPEVLEKVFNLPPRKQGYTPAEISRKFPINEYVEMLKDESLDQMAKRSAAEMLKKNKQKLGILAFIQESMKGFPDGIPTIAEDVLAVMGISPEQLIQEANAQLAQEQQQQMAMTQQQMPPQQGQDMMGMPAMPEFNPEEIVPMSAEEEAAMPSPEQMPPMMGRFGGQMLKKYQRAGAVGDPTIPQSEVYQLLALKKQYEDYLKNPLNQNDPDAYMAIEDKLNQVYSRLNQVGTEQRPIELPAVEVNALSKAPFMPANFGSEGDAFDMMYGALKRNPYSDYAYKVMHGYEPEKPTLVKPTDISKKTNDVKEKTFPGFGSLKDLEEYMSRGPEQQLVGAMYKDALASGDPEKLIATAKEIERRRNLDSSDSQYLNVPYSLSIFPGTDEDRIDNVVDILYEEALRLTNAKQKDNILKTKMLEPSMVKYSLEQLIGDLTKEQEAAATIDEKYAIAKEIGKYNQYKEFIQKGKYNEWYQRVKDSDIVNTPDFGIFRKLGTPVRDEALSFNITNDDNEVLFGDNQTVMGMVEDIFQKYDQKRNTKFSSTVLANKFPFKGRIYPVVSSGSVVDEMNKVYEKTQPVKIVTDDSPKFPTYNINGITYTIKKGAQDSLFWSSYDPQFGSSKKITDDALVKQLNERATNDPKFGGAGKKINLPTPVDTESETQTQNLDKVKTEAKSNNQTITNPVINNSSSSKSTTPAKQKEDDSGLSMDFYLDLDKKQYGGAIGSMIRKDGKLYRYGGTIDERGKLLKKFVLGGENEELENVPTTDDKTKSATDDKTKSGTSNEPVLVKKVKNAKGKELSVYQQKIDDQTTYYITKDENGNIVETVNKETRQKYKDPNFKPTRSNTEWVKPGNLSVYEQGIVDSKWAGNAQAYADYINSVNTISLNPTLKAKMYAQFEKNAKDEGLGIFTGSKLEKQKQFATMVIGKDASGKNITLRSDIQSMTEDDMLRELFEQEERNARLAAVKGKDWVAKTKQNVAGGSGQREYTNEQIADEVASNSQLSDLDFSQGHKGQAAYIAYQQTLLNNPEFSEFADIYQTGAGTETGIAKRLGLKSTISGVDRQSTNDTAAERLAVRLKEPVKDEIIETKKIDDKGSVEKDAFYCVEYTDGTKSVSTVKYKEGEQPIQPSGSTIKTATLLQSPNDTCGTAEVAREPKQSTLWFPPDLANLNAALATRIPNVEPTLREMPQSYSGYVTRNPITEIAGVSSLVKQQQNMANATMDPTSAFAATSGLGYDELAKQIGAVEHENINTVNQYLNNLGQRQMAFDQFNTQARRQFDVDSAIYQEELARDRNKKDALVAQMFGQGYKNMMNDNALRVEYPNAWHVNRPTGTFAWSGVGRNPLLPDTHYSPVSNRGGSDDNAYQESINVYNNAYKEFLSKNSGQEEAAKKHAEDMRRYYLSQNKTNSRKSQQGSYNSGLKGIKNGGMIGAFYTNPFSI